MSVYHYAVSLVLAATCTLACVDSSTSEGSHPANARVVAESQAVWPMPKLETRIARVLAEIGPEQHELRDALAMNGRRLRHSRREALRQLSPRIRGILNRHHVRPLHLARYLKGDTK